GAYTVRLIVTTASGCKDTITRINYIRTGTRPVANFNVVDSVVCYGVMSMFNNLSTGADSAFWQWGDGSTMPMLLPGTNPVTHLYADTGTYTVTLIVYNNGCADTLVQPDIVTILPPKPVFTFQLNCIDPYSVDFTDASIGADSIVWDFGDGSPLVSDSLAPTHVYATRGLKTVTLTAYNFTTNCFFTQPASFTIADPIAQHSTIPAIGCYPLPVTFTNTSQDANISIWKFGDGSPDTTIANPPVHTYTLPGLYTMKLIITDINGCVDSISNNIIVQGAIPDFTADTTTGCKPLPILFSDNSVSDSTLVQWRWDFGDLTSQTTVSPAINHTYMSRGIYSVKMVVTDKNGCADSIIKINYIEATYPFPAFVADTFACKGEVITFNANTTSATGPGVIYSWDFGDGTPTGSGVSPTHSYTADNLYTVTLTVTDKNGCDSSIQHQVRVQHPTADFKDTTIAEGCGFRNVKFTDISTGLYINGWNWDFGDGASSSVQNPTHTYTVPGVYTVSLIVTNIAGCKDTITYPNLVVVPGPIGSFTFAPQTGCNPLTVIFKSNSNNTTEYIWDFGDGSPIYITTDTIVQHTYTAETPFPGANPQLLLGNILSNGSTCRLPATNLTGLVLVTTIIDVEIDSTIVTLPEGDFFIINSSITNLIGTPAYSWTPAYQLSCTDCNTPSVVGDGSGDLITYHFTVTDPNGCIGYDSIKVYYIFCEEELFIPNVFTPNGDGINDEFAIGGVCKQDNYKVQIFNRWGIQLFTTDIKNLAWDGRTKSGEEASDGVYYYVLTHKDKTYTGFLHLMR
ncbi:MAG: PKD domain-containing protein, partial [Bacteroidota bacterium]